jgi:hypothetical protein
MCEDVELAKLLKEHQGELKTIAEAAGSGNQDKVIDAVSSLAVSLATGNPFLAALAPLRRKGIAQIFGSSVNAVLTRELAALAKDEERRAFLHQIDEVVEALLETVRVDSLGEPWREPPPCGRLLHEPGPVCPGAAVVGARGRRKREGRRARASGL